MSNQQQVAPIPFNRPSFVGSELDYLHDALVRNHASSGGEYTRQCVELLRSTLGARDVLLTTSCTDALEMSALLLEIEPGDVVIVPSFTFVTTALAFVRAGATIRFADIEPTTLGIDPASVARLMDDRVRAVVPVHYAGVGCDMAGLAGVLPARVDIIEDNAHGLFGTLDGRLLGSFGRCSTLSFHETKNFSCGEGGALVLNEDRDIERAHNLLDKGTNRRSFMLGQVDKYTWIDTGSSFGLSDLLAAFLLGQLERRDAVLSRREEVWRIYDRRLSSTAAEHGVRSMSVPPDRGCSWHMYYLLLPDGELRASLLAHLAEHGVNATFHYVPLHSAPAARFVTDRVAGCPVTDGISSRLVRLPFHNALEPADQERVCELVEQWMSTNLSNPN
jgi:dTDP-4-amino-4,6-dideoxygalactose transaminase